MRPGLCSALFLTIVSLLPVPSLFAQGGEQPLARLDHALFVNPKGQVYCEVYIRIPAQSLTFKRTDRVYYQAKALVALELQRNKETHYQKQYMISSTKVKDTTQASFVLTDQREIPLHSTGKYELTFTLVDSYNRKNQATARQVIHNPVENVKQPLISDIKRLDTIYPSRLPSRFGEGAYHMPPLATSKVSPGTQWLYFYAELYNADKLNLRGSEVPITVTVSHRGDTLTSRKQFFKPKPLVKVLAKIQADRLKAGPNKLTFTGPETKKRHLTTGISIRMPYRHPSDTLSLQETLAQRSTDTLLKFLEWMRATARPHEADKMALLEKNVNKDSLIHFTTRFWKKRNPKRPLQAWQAYKADVAYVNDHFTNPLYKGYESDRGRVYLQYGPPNTVQRSRDDPNTYPYEIWHYFTTQKQSNVRFVFYSTSILETEFVLLHSDAIGEISNPQWQKKLNRSPVQRDDPFGNDPAWDYQK